MFLGHHTTNDKHQIAIPQQTTKDLNNTPKIQSEHSKLNLQFQITDHQSQDHQITRSPITSCSCKPARFFLPHKTDTKLATGMKHVWSTTFSTIHLFIPSRCQVSVSMVELAVHLVFHFIFLLL
jgi:hypothetical protein